MTKDTNQRVVRKDTKETKKSKKQAEVVLKKKKNHDSSDDDGEEDDESYYPTDSENDEMDEHEYRKFLQKLFPSKYLDKKIKSGEQLKKVMELDEDESSEEDEKILKKKQKKQKASKKIEVSDDEEEDEYFSEEEKPKKKTNKKKPIKKSKKQVLTEESDEEEEEDFSEEEEERPRKKSNKINIIFTIGGANEDEDDDEWEDYEDSDADDWEDADDLETENEDDSVSTGESDEEEKFYEEEVSIPKKKNKKIEKSSKSNKDKNANSKQGIVDKVKSIIEDVESSSGKPNDDGFLQQLKEIYEKNKNNKMIEKCIHVCEEDIKLNKKKTEKKVKKHKDKNERIFRKIIKDKNTMNDFHFFEKLEIEEQKKIIKELREINKITRIEKPYRMTLLEANIPTLFKSAAIKKINTLRYMEPGSGDFYKIKNWVDTFMRIPFGKYETLPINIDDGVEKCHEFMENAQNTLNNAVYGLNDAKMQIMQMLGQLLTNPKSIGTAIAIHGPPGTGKCLVKDTPILMYDGSIKMVQDIEMGDLLMGDDSTPRTVLSLGSGQDDLYDIVPTKGEKYGVNSEHILCLKPSGINRIRKLKNKDDSFSYKAEFINKQDYKIISKRFDNQEDANKFLNEKSQENDVIEIPVKELLQLPKYIRENLKGYSVGVDFPSKQVPFDPYILGVWLGDGDSSSLNEHSQGLQQVLKDLNLLNNKHVPDIYKINDRSVQLELLAGIIDTDGSYSQKDKCYDIIQKNKQLSDDILFITRSLGFTAYQKQCKKSCYYKDEKKEGTYYRISISGNNLHEIPVKITRKQVTEQRLQIKNTMLTGIKIVPKGYGDYYGFELNGNHRYLLGNFTVTHNTSLVKEGISKILNRPFAFIALGGATASSFLEGHSYTYEGSTWGKIVQILIDSKCMNPVIYFDELDKISDTPRGEEITGILTHLTDTSQNSEYHDKYFAEIDFDLSKCLFIFSYNDESKVNPILKDRMYRIQTKGYNQKQKIAISNQYLLPKIRDQVKFEENQIIIPDDTIQYVVDQHCNKEDGVRNLKRCLEIIHTKLNLYRLMKSGSNLFEEDMSLKVEFPFTITKEIVDKLIKRDKDNISALYSMYV